MPKRVECYTRVHVDKSECCGAQSVGTNDKIPLQLTRDKLNHIKNVGALALVTICPFCRMMHDANRGRIEKTFNENLRCTRFTLSTALRPGHWIFT
ncbi:hypothetical protein GTO27_01650 [Candidatus Bathyarchaeota archaeon]|nr:hypothetical protein [Candidatus Bathyarchaeota archaeon]